MTAALLIVLVGVAALVVGWALGRSGRVGHADAPASSNPGRGGSLTEILEGHPTGIVIGDAAGRVEYRNEAARRLTGTHSGVLIDEAIERHLVLGRAGSVNDRTIEFYVRFCWLPSVRSWRAMPPRL